MEQRIVRRTFLRLSAGAAAAIAWPSPSLAARQIGGNRPVLEPIHDMTVCKWSARHPRHDHQLIFPMNDGRLMLVWCEYYAEGEAALRRQPTTSGGQAVDDARCRISARYSMDGARTWGESFTLQENEWKSNVKHPNLLRLPSGEVLFFFVGWDSGAQRNVFLKRSRDECRTWSEREQISEPGWYCNNNDHIVQLRSGRILLPGHGPASGPYEGGKTKLHSWVWYSDDAFKTWQKSAMFTAPGRGAHEPSIVELKDGRLLCLMRTTMGRVYRNYSDDQGQTWSQPAMTELPAPDSPPLVKRIPTTGDLLLLWNNIESRTGRPRTPLTAAVSSDEGETWKHFQDVEPRKDHDAAYAAVTFCDDQALVTYYSRPHNWARDTEVVLRIYKIEQFYG